MAPEYKVRYIVTMETETQTGFAGRFRFLSNFDTTPFNMPRLWGMVRSGEHAFNALKTTDRAEQLRVLNAPTPSKAKYVGRSVTLRPGWDQGERVAVMLDVLIAKFSVPELRQRLVETGTYPLVEFNTWHDQFWGDCTCDRHYTTLGKNMLGELLMAVRAREAAR